MLRYRVTGRIVVADFSIMNTKVLGGGLLAFLYNGLIGRLPSRCLRSAYLKLYLAHFGPVSSWMRVLPRFETGASGVLPITSLRTDCVEDLNLY